MNNVKVLDVTLRDGGCVNNFNFGQRYMNQILAALNESSVEYVELGYIDENKGSSIGRTQYKNEKVIYENFLIEKKPDAKYVAMIDHKKFDINKLEKKHSKSIDGIRYCFHKKDRKEVIPILEKIISLGYETFAQPMITLRYTDREIIDFSKDLSTIKRLSGVYIVDSFGEMKNDDVDRLYDLFDTYLPKSFALGFHSHNNMQLSFSNAVHFLERNSARQLMIDSSVLGMGKGAGNLPTELILEHLNSSYGRNYNVVPILKLIDKVIDRLKSDYKWGYSMPYYLSSINHCTPSYAAYFSGKNMLSAEQLSELLSMVDDAKKISFDKNYAEKLYMDYNERFSFDDSVVCDQLKRIFDGKDVLIIAPGKSIKTKYEIIDDFINTYDPIVLYVNVIPSFFSKKDYVLVCREDAINNLSSGVDVIATSNICHSNGIKYKIDYKKWITLSDSTTRDSGLVIALNLLTSMKAKHIYLAGFDGYSLDYTLNYYDEYLSKEMSKKMVEDRNEFAKMFISQKSLTTAISFVTPSKYEQN